MAVLFAWLRFALIIPGELAEVSREAVGKWGHQEKHILADVLASDSPGKGRGSRRWNLEDILGMFFFFKMFCLCITELGERGEKNNKACLLCKLGKPVPHFCTSLSWVANKATAFLRLALIPAYQQPEILRKEKGKHTAEPGFLKPPHVAISAPGVLSEGSVFRNHQQRSWPIVPCAVQTHSEGPSLPQRTYPTNRDYRGNVAGELETSCLAQGCTAGRQRQKPGILISSPAICSFSPTTTFCLRGVNGTKDNSVWLGIFNRWQLHIQAHTLPDSVAARDKFPLLAQTQFGGCSAGMRWPSEQKFDTRKGKGGPGSCEIWLLKHLHVLQHKLKKLFVWKI